MTIQYEHRVYCASLTLNLTCVRLRSHFSLWLEGKKQVGSKLSAF